MIKDSIAQVEGNSKHFFQNFGFFFSCLKKRTEKAHR